MQVWLCVKSSSLYFIFVLFECWCGVTITSVMQETSDAFDIVPAGLPIELSPPWTRKKQFASSKLRVDDWFERVLTIVIERLTTLMINCPFLDTLTTIADKRANKTKRTTQLYSTIKTDSTSTCRTQETPQDRQKFGHEYFFPSLRRKRNTCTLLRTFKLKHPVTPKHVPTDDIVSRVESVLTVSSKGATWVDQGRHQEQNSFHSTISLTHRLQLDETRITLIKTARKRQGHSHTSCGQGRVTVVMDKGYTDKMCSLVNDKQTYEPRKRDPTPALQRRLNSKLLDLKKTETIDIQLYYRLRCRVLNFTDYLDYTNLTYRWDPLSNSVGLLVINFPNT